MTDEAHITNTLIITGLQPETLKDTQFIENVQRKIIAKLDTLPEDDNLDTETIIKFIVLTCFRRILIVFQNHNQSVAVFETIHELLVKHKIQDSAKMGFSLFDYNNQISELDTLQVPPNVKLFLISPPVSPPNGFDFHRLEEAPGNLQVFTVEEIQKLQAQHTPTPNEQRLKVHAKHQKEHPDLEILLNDSEGPEIPKIILNPSWNDDDQETYHGEFVRNVLPYVRTAMPQKSIFDEIDGTDDEADIHYS